MISLIMIPGAAFLLARGQRSTAFTNALILYGVFVAIGVAVTANTSIIGSDWMHPYLGGSDGEGYFEQAQILVQDGITNFQALIRSNYLGYQLILAILFLIFSPTLLTGLIANAIFLLLAITCLYRATLLLTSSPKAAFLASLACMLTTPHIFYSLVLLKEPALSLAFALILLSITKMFREDRVGVGAIAYAVVALGLIISMRATALMFIVILFAFIGTQLLKKRAHLLIVFLGVLVVIAPFARQFTIYELDSNFLVSSVTENNVITARFGQGDLDLTGIAGQVIGYYILLPFAAKILLFPIPAAVQVLLPFDVWSSQFVDDLPATFFFRNLNILWFGIVLPWLLFAVLRIRQVTTPLLTRLLLAGLVYFLVIAVIYGGLIPRYGGQALFFIYPSIGYWWARSQREVAVANASTRFFLHYYATFAAAALAYLALHFLRG
ncbi:hypothetical protein E5A74_04855 [Sphingomonas naasensis]|uniref:Uncharacterized protein n=1 Tax=Sphingomonas naasensis TaxID=1344951 RepID=A0A4S1WW33_9SPHN|nr:glycosyltransferase family 39 protein [Sphingomonas naasensis]TGX46480.1 hypothetical protein E5A74_04855 [Sphingomonas naasensis]